MNVSPMFRRQPNPSGWVFLWVVAAFLAATPACARKKAHAKPAGLVIPRECIGKVRLVKPCDPRPDGMHAICVYEVTYSCVKLDQ